MVRKALMAFCVSAVLGSGVANATTLDLTALNSFGELGGAFYLQAGVAPTGSGVIHSFVRIASNGDTEQGYNTDLRPLQFDENPSPTFTRHLDLSAVPLVDCSLIAGCSAGGGSGNYREFMLDINQTGDDPLISLDRVIVYLRSAGNLDTFSSTNNGTVAGTDTFNSGNLIYDSGLGNDVTLNFTNAPGSGGGDMFLYIKDSLFTGPNQFVYLYSFFGVPNNNNDGFEEWSVRLPGGGGESNPQDAVPEPASLLLLGSGLAFAARRVRRKQNT
jgi:PEP-CTERM motif